MGAPGLTPEAYRILDDLNLISEEVRDLNTGESLPGFPGRKFFYSKRHSGYPPLSMLYTGGPPWCSIAHLLPRIQELLGRGPTCIIKLQVKEGKFVVFQRASYFDLFLIRPFRIFQLENSSFNDLLSCELARQVFLWRADL